MKNMKQKTFGKSNEKSEESDSENSLEDSEEEEQIISVRKSQAGDNDTDQDILEAYNDIVTVKPNSLKISIKKEKA